MAVGAVRKFPNDTRQRVGIGVDIPFSSGGVFTPNYTTREAIKNNIINFFQRRYKYKITTIFS